MSLNLKKIKMNKLVIGVVAALALAGAPAFAGVTVTGGNLSYYFSPPLQVGGSAVGGPLVASLAVAGTGGSTGSFVGANYDISGDGFYINDVNLARANDSISAAVGAINFSVTTTVNYDIAGFLKFAENGIPGASHMEFVLTNYSTPFPTTIAACSYTNTSLDLGKLTLGGTSGDVAQLLGSLTGTLAPGNYTWEYLLTIADATSSDASAVATGDMSIHFSDNVGNIPEPASVGILSLAVGGLLLRRRK